MNGHISLKLSSVTKLGRSGNVRRLDGITAEVVAGTCTVLLGRSGSGKSTLLSLLNRMYDPDEGVITYQQRSLSEWDVLELRRDIGLVLQQPTMLPGTVAQNIGYGPSQRKENVSQQEITQLLRKVALPEEFAMRPANELSGGEKQRVALARVLANRPKVLLLDEVTAAVDNKVAQIIEQTVITLCRDGMTVLWVTHDLGQARRVGNWVWFLDGGKLIEVAPEAEFFECPSSEQAKNLLARVQEE